MLICVRVTHSLSHSHSIFPTLALALTLALSLTHSINLSTRHRRPRRRHSHRHRQTSNSRLCCASGEIDCRRMKRKKNNYYHVHTMNDGTSYLGRMLLVSMASSPDSISPSKSSSSSSTSSAFFAFFFGGFYTQKVQKVSRRDSQTQS